MATRFPSHAAVLLLGAALGFVIGFSIEKAPPSPPPSLLREHHARCYDIPGQQPKTLYLYGQVHFIPGYPWEYAAELVDSQGFIAQDLNRLIASGALDTVVGEGLGDPDPVVYPWYPTLSVAPGDFERLMLETPRGISYTILKQKWGPKMRLLGSAEATYLDPSGDEQRQTDHRSEIFLGDMIRALSDRDVVAGVIGRLHVPAILEGLHQATSFTVNRPDAGAIRISRPRVVVCLTGADFSAEQQFIEKRLPEARPVDPP